MIQAPAHAATLLPLAQNPTQTHAHPAVHYNRYPLKKQKEIETFHRRYDPL